MTALVHAIVARQAERLPDLGVVAAFSLAGIVLSLLVAHLGLDVTSMG